MSDFLKPPSYDVRTRALTNVRKRIVIEFDIPKDHLSDITVRETAYSAWNAVSAAAGKHAVVYVAVEDVVS